MGIGLATRIENSLFCVAGRLGRGKKARGARWEGEREDCYFHWYTVKFRKKPRDLNFSKALFEGLIFGGAYIRRDLSTEGNFLFKIDWASLIVGGKFTVFALFYFVNVIQGNFQVQALGRAYIWSGDLREDFLRYKFVGAYIWRGLYMEGLIFGILRYAGESFPFPSCPARFFPSP